MSTQTTVLQNRDDFYCFAVYDSNTKKLLYSKYNFDFDKYSQDKNYINLTKNQIFYNFLVENETDLWKPFNVKENLKQYFFKITQEIQIYLDDYNYTLWGFNYNTLTSYINWDTVMKNEFNLINYDYFLEIPNVIEFLHDDIDDYNIYSKYNFNFDSYSAEFNVHGSKICIFSDLLLRLSYLSGNAPGFIGYYKIPDVFKKHFLIDSNNENSLQKYLEKYSVFSCFPNISKSPTNIDYTHYSSLIKDKYNINFSNITEAKKYYLKYGQFQQDEILFLLSKDNEILNLSKSVCSVFSSNSIVSGFLTKGSTDYDIVKGVKQIYLITCYHLIEKSSKDVLFVSCYYNENTNIKLLFRIIGYDKHTDICIAIYDDTLDYNKTFFPESQYDIRNTLHLLDINCDIDETLGQEIITIGNPGLFDNSSYMQGKIMDPNYCGNFNGEFILSYPPTILSDMHISLGQSGSPLFLRDPKDNLLKCSGMINAKLGDEYQYSMGINNHLFKRIINNGMAYWFILTKRYGLNDIENISYYIQDIFPKKWLGASCCYYNPKTAEINNPAFQSFTFNGGIIINNFIVGFNTITEKYIYYYENLSKQGTIKIDTPLLKSKMYNKYIYNNRVPIVIKSMKLYDLVNGVYKTFYLGKYEGQHSMDILTYGFMQTSTLQNVSEYTNMYYRTYSKILFEFFYFNGKEWILDSEEVGGNDETWFNTYYDDYGHKFLQHKFEFPNILNAYVSTFAIDYENSAKNGARQCYDDVDSAEQYNDALNSGRNVNSGRKIAKFGDSSSEKGQKMR